MTNTIDLAKVKVTVTFTDARTGKLSAVGTYWGPDVESLKERKPVHLLAEMAGVTGEQFVEETYETVDGEYLDHDEDTMLFRDGVIVF